MNKILRTIHIYPTYAEANKYGGRRMEKGARPRTRPDMDRALPPVASRLKHSKLSR